jgi:hypothetical protein
MGNAGGLTPIGGGLTPLGPASGLTPLGADPFGGMPSAGGDLLAGLTPANVSGHTLGPSSAIPNPYGPAPAGFGGGAPNPYASPAGAAYGSGPSYAGGISDAGRKGLPWERSADMDSFQDTAMQILGEPQSAFMQMRRSGGIMNAMAFWVIAAIIGQIVNTVYGTILAAILLAVGNAKGEAYLGLLMFTAIRLVGDVIGVLILAPIGAFIGAGLWHVVLLVFGCARGGFEATFRAQCFVGGAVAMLNIIPFLGPLIGLFYAIALFIQAFTHAHDAPGGRVTAAVLSVYGLLCCCLAPLVGLAAMSVLSQMGMGRPPF